MFKGKPVEFSIQISGVLTTYDSSFLNKKFIVCDPVRLAHSRDVDVILTGSYNFTFSPFRPCNSFNFPPVKREKKLDSAQVSPPRIRGGSFRARNGALTHIGLQGCDTGPAKKTIRVSRKRRIHISSIVLNCSLLFGGILIYALFFGSCNDVLAV